MKFENKPNSNNVHTNWGLEVKYSESYNYSTAQYTYFSYLHVCVEYVLDTVKSYQKRAPLGPV